VFHRFPYTSLAIALAIGVLAAVMLWHIDVFQLPGDDLVGIEESESGEVVIAFLLVIPAFFVDRVVARQRAHEARIQSEQVRVLRVTMRTVQAIVNNNLNQLQLLRIEAEGLVPADTLTLFDAALTDTAEQLTALGNLTVFVDKPMASGSGVEVGR
jgi:hypothetical protein